MDLTSQAINEAEFSMARRGYDPDQVDEFLEKLAVAVDKQSEALGEARERAAMAERRAADAERRAGERPERVVEAGPAPEAVPSGPSAVEVSAAAEAELETLKRTLVMAQKTADATIRDAEQEARRMIASAEEDARVAQEGTRKRLLEEIGSLESGRDALRVDVDALDRHFGDQRARLKSTVNDLQRLLDDPERLRSAPAPALAAPVATPELAPAPEEEDAALSAPPAERATLEGGEDGPGDDRDGGSEDDRDGGSEDDAWARFGGDPADDFADLEGGPPTQPVLRLDEIDRQREEPAASGEDAYLSELRKAMLEDTGAPDLDDEAGSRPRFGRRR